MTHNAQHASHKRGREWSCHHHSRPRNHRHFDCCQRKYSNDDSFQRKLDTLLAMYVCVCVHACLTDCACARVSCMRACMLDAKSRVGTRAKGILPCVLELFCLLSNTCMPVHLHTDRTRDRHLHTERTPAQAQRQRQTPRQMPRQGQGQGQGQWQKDKASAGWNGARACFRTNMCRVYGVRGAANVLLVKRLKTSICGAEDL